MDLNFKAVYEETPPRISVVPNAPLCSSEEAGEITGAVLDRKHATSEISTDCEHATRRLSLEEPIAFVLTNDSFYINSVVSNFDWLWEQAIPAAQR